MTEEMRERDEDRWREVESGRAENYQEGIFLIHPSFIQVETQCLFK